MATLKYKIIKSIEQYDDYCSKLESLIENKNRSIFEDEIELLTILIEKWDQQHSSFEELNPIELIRSLMAEHDLKSKDLVKILHVSKGLVSDILNYKKGISKEIIRKLSSYFKLSQEAFNRPYKLASIAKGKIRSMSTVDSFKLPVSMQ
jgi:HTH-type transcriptional regulator/antitoxin HigA